jgi:hypothetical protein
VFFRLVHVFILSACLSLFLQGLQLYLFVTVCHFCSPSLCAQGTGAANSSSHLAAVAEVERQKQLIHVELKVNGMPASQGLCAAAGDAQ